MGPGRRHTLSAWKISGSNIQVHTMNGGEEVMWIMCGGMERRRRRRTIYFSGKAFSSILQNRH